MNKFFNNKIIKSLVTIKLNKRSAKDLENVLTIGTAGSGKARHPWDNLKRCSCGGYPFMMGNDGVFESGYPYQIECDNCDKHTQKGEVENIKEEWNNILN